MSLWGTFSNFFNRDNGQANETPAQIKRSVGMFNYFALMLSIGSAVTLKLIKASHSNELLTNPEANSDLAFNIMTALTGLCATAFMPTHISRMGVLAVATAVMASAGSGLYEIGAGSTACNIGAILLFAKCMASYDLANNPVDANQAAGVRLQ